MRPTYRSAPVLSPATINTVLTTFAKGTPPHLRVVQTHLSSPDSIYSECSPAFPHYLSESEGEVEHYEEEDYDAILAGAGAGPSWGQWSGQGVPDWVGHTTGRRRSIITISPRGSIGSRQSRRTSSKFSDDRRGSDPSLLGFGLPQPRRRSSRRRSSGLSVSTTASSLDPAEAKRMKNFASLQGISRRFSEVVEVTAPSDSESSGSDYGSKARAAFAEQWSPDSPDSSSDDSDGVSEVRTAPYYPTPPVVRPAAFSNFPLQSFAQAQSTPIDNSRDSSPTPIFERFGRPQATPSPPMAPADYLRARTRAPIVASSSSTAPSAVMQRPRPAFTRCVSNPFLSAAPATTTPSGLLPAHALVPSMTLGRSSLYHSMLRSSTASDASDDDSRPGPVGLGLDPSLIPSRRASIDVTSRKGSRAGSLIEGAADFAYLASEIQVESDPAEATPRPLPSRKAPGTLALPSFTFEPASTVTTPFTPRFNPMDSFLGITTPPSSWSSGSSPQQSLAAAFSPMPISSTQSSPTAPARQVRWSDNGYPGLESTQVSGPSRRVFSARKPVPLVNVDELDHSFAEASVSRATLRRGAVAVVPTVASRKRRSITALDAVVSPARPQLHSRSRSEIQTRQATLSHRISMPVMSPPQQVLPVTFPSRPVARRTASTSSFTRFFQHRKPNVEEEKQRPPLRSQPSESGSSGSDRTLVEVQNIFRKLGVGSPKQSPSL